MTTATQIVPGYKAFNPDMTCRGHQFAVGETATQDAPPKLCESGFHYCTDALDVLNYYPLVGSVFAEVSGVDPTSPESDCSKVATASLTVAAQLTLPKFISAIGAAIAARAMKATTGDSSAAATTGYSSAAATTGDRSAAATTGYRSAAATTGYSSAAATTGYKSAAATTGYSSAAATTGDRSAAATTGDRSAAATTGKNSPAVACGILSTASAGIGSSICAHEYDDDYNLIAVACSMVGENGIQPNVAYKCVDGKLTPAI